MTLHAQITHLEVFALDRCSDGKKGFVSCNMETQHFAASVFGERITRRMGYYAIFVLMPTKAYSMALSVATTRAVYINCWPRIIKQLAVANFVSAAF